MSGPKRNPDKLNTIGVVVVGLCGAVMVYVSIAALQAFYMNDTSEIQTMADYGGQESTARGNRANELRNITEAASNPPQPGAAPTYRIDINVASKLVVDDARTDPSHLTGSAMPKAVKETIPPAFGRPKIGAAPAADGSGAGSAAPAGGGSAAPATGSGSAAPAGAGSAAGSAAPPDGAAAGSAARPAGAPAPGAAATQTPTGAGAVAPPGPGDNPGRR